MDCDSWDFVVLYGILYAFSYWHWRMAAWDKEMLNIFVLVNNIALMLSQLRFSTIIHLRLVGAGDILQRLIGLMSIVGPSPHMLAHTEQYSQLIDKYMVRHFVKHLVGHPYHLADVKEHLCA